MNYSVFSERAEETWEKGHSGCITIGQFTINIYKHNVLNNIVLDIYYKNNNKPFCTVPIGTPLQLQKGVIAKNQIELSYALLNIKSPDYDVEILDALINLHSTFVTLFGSPRIQNKYINNYPTTLEDKFPYLSESIWMLVTFYLRTMPFIKNFKRELERELAIKGTVQDKVSLEEVEEDPYIRILIDREQMGKVLFNKTTSIPFVTCDVIAFEHVGKLNLTDGLFIQYEDYVKDVTESRLERLIQSKKIKAPNRMYTVLHVPYQEKGYDLTNEVLLQPLYVKK